MEGVPKTHHLINTHSQLGVREILVVHPERRCGEKFVESVEVLRCAKACKLLVYPVFTILLGDPLSYVVKNLALSVGKARVIQ